MSATIIPLAPLPAAGSAADLRAEMQQGGGCASGSCGGRETETLSPDVKARVENHPCYSEDAHHYFARMHVAVAPGCNIQCNYCNRKYDCANESRPGVVSERLTPETAARKVVAVANRLPQLSVLGVAGPGDALFQADRTFETFDRVGEVLPDLTFCLSTNGLALPDHVEAIRAHDVHHVTVTINAVDPAIGARIHPWIYFNHRRWRGEEAARILMERQLEGLSALVAAGVLVKVNSVMIPGINDTHLEEVHAEVTKRGAFLHNIMPLISDPAHGTHFGLEGRPAPTPQAVQALQEKLGGATLMKHCRQCRADAVGLLGQDAGAADEVASTPAAALAAEDARHEERDAYRAVVAQERAERAQATAAAEARLAARADTETRLVAVCTQGGGRINLHFGHATEFQVYAVNADGVRFKGIRRADNYCLGGHGDADRLDTLVETLKDIHTVLCVKIGDRPRQRLADAGIQVDEQYGFDLIEEAIAAWSLSLARQDRALA